MKIVEKGKNPVGTPFATSHKKTTTQFFEKQPYLLSI